MGISLATPAIRSRGIAFVHLERIGAVLLVFLGFWLRVFRLDLQSIWSDEGLSIYRASQSLSAIPTLSEAGIHPPLYDSLLHFWIRMAGSREFSTRFLSLFFGVLALAILFQIGRLLLGRKGAMLGMLVATASPFLIYYSQETRMYAPALFFCLLSVLAVLRWMRSSGSRAWLACYVLSSAAATYTHYYSWLVVASLNLFVIAWVLVSGRPALDDPAPDVSTVGAVLEPPLRAPSFLSDCLDRMRGWVVAQVALGVVYVPWAGVLINKYETYLTPGSIISPLTVLYQTVVSFGLSYSAGRAASTPGQIDVPAEHQRVLAMALVLALIAAWGMAYGILSRRQGFRLQWAFLPVCLLLPVAGIIALSWGKRDFAPRYVIFAAPAYYLLMGQGLGSLVGGRRIFRRCLGGLALLAVLGFSCLSLYNYYYDPTYWRDDIRGTVDFINQQSRSDDAVVLNAYYLEPSFDYYFHGDAPVVGLPDSTSPNWDKELGILQDLANKHDRIWLVLWQTYYTDPQGRIQEWLDKNGFRFKITQFRGGFMVVGYLTKTPVSDTAQGQPVGLDIAHTVRLETYQINQGPICAGTNLPFTLYWRALQPMSSDYSVFVHLVDDSGKTWAQADSQPSGGGFPTSRWPVGSVVADERLLSIPSDTPPGRYFLQVGMYDLKTMKRLGEGDPEVFQADLGPLEVQPEGCNPQH